MIPEQFLSFIILNKNKWFLTKGHKTCSVCGYNTRQFKYHSYINKDIELHIRTEHIEETKSMLEGVKLWN